MAYNHVQQVGLVDRLAAVLALWRVRTRGGVRQTESQSAAIGVAQAGISLLLLLLLCSLLRLLVV